MVNEQGGAAPGKNLISYRSRKKIVPWMFVLPCLAIILIVTVFPTIYTLGLSFTKWEIQLPNRPFIGFGNYTALFKDSRFRNATFMTAMVIFFGVGIELVLGFSLAQLFTGRMVGKRVLVAAFLLPVMVMPVVVGYTWRLLWDAQYGPINHIIGWIIGRPFYFTWLGNRWSATFAILVTEIWQWTPFMFLVFMSGLASLDTEIFEAADIDGASRWKKLWFLEVPLLKPIMIVALLIRGLDALKFFDIIFTLSKGGPGTSTETIAYYIYETGYQFFRLGYGAAASFVMLIVIAVILTYLMKLFRAAFE